MKLRYVFALVLFLVVAACTRQTGSNDAKQEINQTLDNWHEAAAAANFEQYFSHFASDSAIFMGTDATERWTVPEFKEYARPHFDSGDAWNFTPTQRDVYLSANGEVAWFDEVLGTPNLGPARGTGVLVHQDTTWKITHYNLSIPIPNAIADTVVQQVEEALSDSTAKN